MKSFLQLNQTFKQELIQAVPYYFKEKLVHIYLDVANGTSLSCSITITDATTKTYSMTMVVTDKTFLKTFTFTSPGDTFPNISATCQNRANFRDASLPLTHFDFRQIPQALTNFSVRLSKQVLSTFQSLTVTMFLATGKFNFIFFLLMCKYVIP